MPDGLIAISPLAATERLVGRPGLLLSDSRTAAAASLATVLRLGRRGHRLSIRFDCRHRGIVATLRVNNAPLWTEDVVECFLAFDDPPARYLELEVNPLGAKFAAIVDSPNLSREGMSVRTFSLPGLRAETRVRGDRWSAVVSMPIRQAAGALSGSRSGDDGSMPEILRANFFRIDRTSGEFSALFPTFRDPPDFHVPERFGRFCLTV